MTIKLFPSGKWQNPNVLSAEKVGRLDVCWVNRTLLGQNWKANRYWNLHKAQSYSTRIPPRRTSGQRTWDVDSKAIRYRVYHHVVILMVVFYSDEGTDSITPPAPSSSPPALPPRPPSLLPLMSPRPRPVPPPHAPAYQSPTSPQTSQHFQGRL